MVDKGLPLGDHPVVLAMLVFRDVSSMKPMRGKAHAGLSLIVQEVLGRDHYSGAIFIFRSRRGDQMKCLVWDQTGLVLIYKMLEGGAYDLLPMAQAVWRDEP